MLFKISALAALVSSAVAHMAITSPCPRYSAHGVNCPAVPDGQALDYSLKSPLGADQALCKYTTPYATPSASWTAGQSVTVSFQNDGAAHGGGHCQFSLSYDGGKTFVVVHEELQYCFFGAPSGGNSATILDYTFNLPTDLPSSDKAVFAWTWVNAIGNREFYMNCADIAIKGTSSSYTGKQMTIANHDGYPTIPEFSGDYTTGLSYYTNAPKITVTGSGSSSSSGSSGSGSSGSSSSSYASSVAPPVGHTPSASTLASVPVPVYTSTAPVSKPTPTSAPKPASSAAPNPAPTSGSSGSSSGCTHGAMQCSGTGYKVCVWGKWTAQMSCAAGTVCKQSSAAAIICDWP